MATEEIVINNKVSVPASEIEYRFSRSGGPGGQNVNKVSTKVELLFDLAHSNAFTDEEKRRLGVKLARYMDSTGVLSVTAQESRSQFQNRRTVVEKFRLLVAKALHVPRARKATRPTHASAKKRVEVKKKRSVTKRQRSKRIDLE